MYSNILESSLIAKKWRFLRLTTGGTVELVYNAFYPLDASFYVDLIRNDERRLVSMEIWPVARCNQKCVFCSSDIYSLKSNQEINFDALCRLINDIADMGNIMVRFSGGGEPFLFKRMPEVIKLIANRNMLSYFITNGSVLSDELIEIIVSVAKGIRISFNGGSKEDYIAIHGCDHFSTVTNNMKKLANMRKINNREDTLSLGVTHIITPQNFHHVSEAVKIVKDSGFDFVLLRGRNPVKHLFQGRDRDILGNQLEICQSLRDDRFFVNGLLANLDGTKPKKKLRSACYATHYRTYVNYDGNVFSCFNSVCARKNAFGNIINKSIKNIWENELHLGIRSRLEQGNYFDYCQGHCGYTDFNKGLEAIYNEIIKNPQVKFQKIPSDWAEKYILSEDITWF